MYFLNCIVQSHEIEPVHTVHSFFFFFFFFFFFLKKFSHRQDVQIAKASVSTSKSNRNTESAKKKQNSGV